MQYQLIQDTLTYLMNGVAISGVLAAGTTIVYQYWTEEPKEPNPPLDEQLRQLQQQLQETQQQLAQSHQHKVQIQSCFDAKLQQAQQQEKQARIELNQLRQKLSSNEEELQKTQQELNTTKEGVQGLVNQIFVSDKRAKEWVKKILSNQEVTQQPTLN